MLIFLFLVQLFSSLALCTVNTGADSTLSISGANGVFQVDHTITNFSGKLKLKDDAAGTITGTGSIDFVDGCLTTGNIESRLSGTYDPTGTDTITLEDTDYIDVTSGTVSQTIAVANGATTTLRGQPKLTAAIALGNASSVLQVDIASSLNQSITGLGKVSLLGDLTLESGVQLPSLVDNNGHKLTFTGGTYTTDLTLRTGGQIAMNGSIAIDSDWSIGTGAEEYVWEGNGNTLTVEPDHEITNDGAALTFSNIYVDEKTAVGPLYGVLGQGRVKFINAAVKFDDIEARFSSNYRRVGANRIDLEDGDYIDLVGGIFPYTIVIDDASATGTIRGSGQFAEPILLVLSSTTVQLDLASNLNQSVGGAGKLSLLSDLTLDSGIALPSLVDNNGKILHITGGTYSTAITWATGGSIELHSATTLNNTWTFSSGTYAINGHGNVLTLGGSGIIDFDGTELVLTDMHIKGVTGTNIRGTGTIKMSNCTLELSGNYTRSDGDWTVEADNCKVITNGSTFTMSGAGNDLTVDGVILFYEQLNGTEDNPFATASGAAINETNNGDIRNVAAGSGGGAAPCIFSTVSSTLTENCIISSVATVEFDGPGGAVDRDLDGDGHFIQFSQKSNTFILDNDVTTDLTNIVLKDFDHTSISYGTSAVLRFGDGVQICMGKDLTIASGDVAWTCNGDVVIDGGGRTLTIEKAQGLTITGAKTLTLQNMRLEISATDAIKCLSSDAIIRLKNSEVVMLGTDLTFDAGHLEVEGMVSMKNAQENGSTFTLDSGVEDLTILDDATLAVNLDVTFLYDPGARNKLVFATTNSHLYLDNCIFDAGVEGIDFTQGIITCDNYVVFLATTVADKQITLDDAMKINLLHTARLDLQGPAFQGTPVPPTPPTALTVGDFFVLRSKETSYGNYFLKSSIAATDASIEGDRGYGNVAGSYVVYAFESSSGSYPNGTAILSASTPPVDNRYRLKSYEPTTHTERTGTGMLIRDEASGALSKPPYYKAQHHSDDLGNEIQRPFMEKVGGIDGDFILDGDTVHLFIAGDGIPTGYSYIGMEGVSLSYVLLGGPAGVHAYYGGAGAVSTLPPLGGFGDQFPSSDYIEWEVRLESLYTPPDL